jgi:tetratricopeptide (TPR) repeat protein
MRRDKRSPNAAMPRVNGRSTPIVQLFTGVLLILTMAAAAAAAESAQSLYSRGLVQFHRQRYAEALTLFEQAVAADPQDAYARYYRGVTYLQLKRVDDAIADLQFVIETRPDIEQAQLEVGVALVEAERFEAAIPHLQRARDALPQQAARASLFLGIAHLRLGQNQDARAAFERAAGDSEIVHTARYYQGVIDYLDERWPQAQVHFRYVADAKPGSKIGAEALRYLEQMQTDSGPSYSLYAVEGLEYDSNVAIAPIDDDAKLRQGVDDQAAGRFVLGAGGVYVPWRNDWAQLSLGYDFFQSLHFELDEFDMQDHRPSVQLAGQKGAFSFGVFARYDFYLMDWDAFLQQGVGVPFVAYDIGELGRSELFVRLRFRDFLDNPYNGVLDAWNYGPGVRQVFNLGTPQRSAWIGYRFDREDTINHDGDAFAYDGHEVGTGMTWLLGERFRTDIGYAFRHEEYDAASGGRTDLVHLPVAAFWFALSEHWSITLAYLGTFNESDKEDFDYQRHIGSLTIAVTI